MGKGTTTTSGELLARTGFKRELQFVLKSQSEICGGECLGRTRANRRNLNVEATSSGGCGLKKDGDKKIRLSVLEKLAKRRMKTTMTISDLPEDLVADILSRLPITSLGSIRSTCKLWNVLSKNRIFGKVIEAKNMFVGFMMNNLKICSVRIDLQKIFNDVDDFIIDLSIKQVSVLNQILVGKIYHCDGLLLCTHDTSRLSVWNPYLGQRRWIPHLIGRCDGFSLGYDNSSKHKILQYLGFYDHKSHPAFGFKIYEFSSNSWRNLDVTPNWKLPTAPQIVTLKGNAYFHAKEEIIVAGATKIEYFILCFDFTSERFKRLLSLPFHCYPGDSVVLSCVRDELLAVLYQPLTESNYMEIWVTNNIDYNEVLWTKWMQVDKNPLTTGSPADPFPVSFFIDVGNKAAVVFYKDILKKRFFYPRAHIIGQDGYFRPLNVQAVTPNQYGILVSLLCSSSYVPSLVQIE